MNNNINFNEELKPKQEIVQTQNNVENQQIEKLKRQNEGIFKYIVEYLSEQCKNMKKNDRLKKLLKDIKILREKTYEINFKYNVFREDNILKKERVLLRKLKEFISNRLKFLKRGNFFKFVGEYESEEEFKEKERYYYEFIDELYGKLEDLKTSYEIVLNNCKDYEVNKKYESLYIYPVDLTLSEENDFSIIPKEDLVEYEKVKNEFDIKNENINLFFTLMERLNVECEKMHKNTILKKILFNLLVKRQEYMFYVLKREIFMYSFEKEANLLKEIEDVLNSFNSQFFKFAEIYELGQNLDDECFLRVKDLYSKLEDLTKFYGEDRLFKSAKVYKSGVRLGDERSLHVKDLYNKLEDLPKFYGEDYNREIKRNMEFLENVGNNTNYYLNYKLLKKYLISKIEEVDEYYELFMDCFYKIAEYLNGFSFEKPKNFINKNGDDDKPIIIFKDIKEKKENLKYISFMDLYLKLYNRRNFFRRVLAKCYRLHLDIRDREFSNIEYIFYLYDLVLKEKQNLKYLFSYLENLVRYFNLDNVKSFRNKLNLEEQFNINNEFNEKYDPNSEKSYPVEFKYNVYDIAEEFYEKNSKKLMKYFFDINLYKTRGNEDVLADEYLDPSEYLDWRKMYFFMYKDKILETKEQFIDGLKDASKNERNTSCFKFLKEVFKNLEDEMKKEDYSKNYGYKKLKGLINTLLFMETYEYGDFEFENERMLEEDILRVRRFFQFFDDKHEKNKELCNFLLKYSKDKENISKNSSKEIAEFFSNELKNELKKVKNEPVKGRNLLTGRSINYPAMFKDKFAINFSKDFDCYITNHLNNGKEVTVEDPIFNIIYEIIKSLVDKDGNLKRDFVNVEYSKYNSEALNELSEKLSELIKFLIEGINLYRPLKKS